MFWRYKLKLHRFCSKLQDILSKIKKNFFYFEKNGFSYYYITLNNDLLE
jgi:hypothetical protein